MTMNDVDAQRSDTQPSYQELVEFSRRPCGSHMLDSFLRARDRIGSNDGAAELADLCCSLQSVMFDLYNLSYDFETAGLVEYALATADEYFDLESLEREFSLAAEAARKAA